MNRQRKLSFIIKGDPIFFNQNQKKSNQKKLKKALFLPVVINCHTRFDVVLALVFVNFCKIICSTNVYRIL